MTLKNDSYAFQRIEKFCETCGKRLVLKQNRHIERKRFCSISCRMKATNKMRKARPLALFHVCKRCKKEKPVSAFYSHDLGGKGYPRQYCKLCYKSVTYESFGKHPEWVMKARTRRKLNRASFPFRIETVRALGLTLEEAVERYKAQGGVCAVCGAAPNGKRLALDHDHLSGRPRQFLCCACNADLSVLENKERLEKLQAYLRKHEDHADNIKSSQHSGSDQDR